MHDALEAFMVTLSWPWLGFILLITIYALGKGADGLVTAAVALSHRSKIPKFIIGTTIVSLGTTMPEAVVSVMAAIGGNPGLALGNAVGSIICDTALIVGICCLIAPLPVAAKEIKHGSWLQLGAGTLLVAICFPWTDPSSALTVGGQLPQAAGFLFVFLLVVYFWHSIRSVRGNVNQSEQHDEEQASMSIPKALAVLVVAAAVVILSSSVLISAATETAQRLSVPEGVIAATLVALGTSFPELVTCLTATIKRHGELAVGNVIGADILNVLFVTGAAASVTAGGLEVASYFFSNLFIAMLAALIIFKLGIHLAGPKGLGRGFGIVLLMIYVVAVFSSF